MKQRFKLGIRLTTVSFFILVTLFTSTLAVSLQYYFGQRMARTVAQDAYVQVSDTLVSEISSVEKQSTNALELLAGHPVLTHTDNPVATRDLFALVLRQNPLFYGLYIGRSSGDFYELINLETSSEARSALQASVTDRWVEMVITGEAPARKRTFRYYDDQFQLRFERDESTDYDPRSRSWYQQATASQQVTQTAPYLFAQLQQPGQTLAKSLTDQQSVLGMDLLLTSLSAFLRERGFGQDKGDAFVFQANGELIASSAMYTQRLPLTVPDFSLTEAEQQLVASLPQLQVSNEMNWPPLDYSVAGEPRGYSIDLLNLLADMTGLTLNYVNGLSWTQLVDAFQRGHIDVLQSLILTDSNRDWGLPTDAYVTLPFALASLTPNSTLASLAGKKLAIPSGWSIIPIIQQRFPTINVVETRDTLEALQWVLAGTADAALDNEVILQNLIKVHFLDGLFLNRELGLSDTEQPNQLHLMLQPDQAPLQALLNRAIAVAVRERGQILAQRWLEQKNDQPVNAQKSVPATILLELASSGDQHGTLQSVTYQGDEYYAYVRPLGDGAQQKYFGVLVSHASVVGPFVNQVSISIVFSAILLALMLPLSWWFANPIVKPVRQLADENDKIRHHREAKVKRVRSHIVEIDELSESIVQMVQTIKQQEQNQRDILDSFIQLIAEAIDQKSPYTGGHCARVPDLALMLVDAAHRSDDPAFRDFKVHNDDAWREIRIAAWLHDCGKVTTPEFIVDKGTKLETIHNRIHEIRMRFEVLWRDADIRYLQQCAEQPDLENRWSEQRENTRTQLQEDYAFIAQCNIGGEYLDDGKQNRLKQLATIEWQRNFNDRLGLSPPEEKRYQSPPQPLPVMEPLLRDGPEHLIQRPQSTDYPKEFGINMEIPEYLYNRGELYNLLISRGTLTPEDRFKINEHMISTIRMLEALPFPEELKRVPKFASTHHETLDGRGYPRKLSANDLSIPERMLAVADIFEALTAADRPYKKGKTLKQTLDILSKMADDKHVDRDAFELLLTSGIYQQYAEKYLAENQKSDVDIREYVRA